MSYYDTEASAFKAMEQANTAMCPHGGSVPKEDKDNQVALANGIMLANAVGFGLLQIAEAIKKLKGCDIDGNDIRRSYKADDRGKSNIQGGC